MEDLHRLQESKWIASTLSKTSAHMEFCQKAVSYNPALPVPEDGGSAAVEKLVQKQDNAAATMFYYHMSGLGLEAWDYKQPENENDCVKSVWRMVCFTYFPRAEVGLEEGAISKYIRPCQSSCQNYLRQCEVECCDEGVQCVFSHTKAISPTETVTTEGYAPHDGPSSLCTGGTKRSTTVGALFWALLGLKTLFSVDSVSMPSFSRLFSRKVVMVSVLLAAVLSLQGCSYDVPIHKVANWRASQDYLVRDQFVPPGGSAKYGSLNSCNYPRLSGGLQCSGRGTCKRWSKREENELAFCECDRDWADPECRTKRKSQTVAFFLSMFGGFLGIDQWYLGFYVTGFFKLITMGGLGIWWIYDIIRIGSAPVHASGTYRTAADLPHFAYVITIVMFALLIGFVTAHKWISAHRFSRRKAQMNLQLDEESRERSKDADYAKPFGDAYTTGMYKPIIPQEEWPDYEKMFPYKEEQQGSSGYGSMGGSQPAPTSQMPAGQNLMSSMGGAGPMPSMSDRVRQMQSMGGGQGYQ